MASTAPAYPNSRASDSGKFARIELVRASTLAERHRNLLVAMLHKNRFGDELWMSTESICVVMGRVCYRRKIAGTDTRGRKLGSCEQISRRAVQRLIDELTYCRECGKPGSAHPVLGSDASVVCRAFVPRVDGGGVLDQVYGANELVPYGGGRKFRHTATYRLNPDKLVARKTHDEYVEERDRARARSRQAHREESKREHVSAEPTPIRKPAQPAPPPLPPAPGAPLPKRDAPAAEKPEHRSTDSAPPPPGSRADKRIRELRQQLMAKMAELMRGHTRHTDAFGGYGCALELDDPRYRAPMSQEHALISACMSLGISDEEGREHLKLCQWKYADYDATPQGSDEGQQSFERIKRARDRAHAIIDAADAEAEPEEPSR